jgi:hypothetical protein
MRNLEVIPPTSPVAYEFKFAEVWHAVIVSVVTFLAMELGPILMDLLRGVEESATLPEPTILYKLSVSLIAGLVRAVVAGVLTVLTKKAFA